MKTIDEIRDAFHLVHRVATGQSDRAYMSIPANPERDADLIVAAAIDELGTLRADLAKAQARCVEMANALRKAEHAMCGAGGNGCFCRCPVIDGHGPGCELVAALASDGTSALASVRLAQRALDEVTGGAAIYGDGRLQDDMRAEILAAKAALAEAFGSGE